MLIDKLDALLRLKQSNMNKFAKEKDIKQTNLSQKGKRNSFYLKEAILIAEYTNTTLAFIDNETGKPVISFDTSDIKDNKKV